MAQNPISTPLPADLPVNWTEGQTVAPSGPDVGLSQQHGYNYQSQQINSAQSAINTIGSAFSNLYGNTDIVPVVNGGTGGETAEEARENLGAASNENLLINWDFRNPVNTRGRSEYTGTGYTVDGWLIRGDNLKCTIEDKGIRLTVTTDPGTDDFMYLNQRVDNDKALLGKTITISFEITQAQCSGPGFSLRLNDSDDVKYNTDLIVNAPYAKTPGIYSATVTLPETLKHSGINFAVYAKKESGNGDYIVISRMKLELGSVSTLKNNPPANRAEQENLCARFGQDGNLITGPLHCNPNLLINWDFRNPVNQRGQETYSAIGYAIDQWRIFASNVSVSVGNGFITQSAIAETGSRGIAQTVEEPPAGEVITFTVDIQALTSAVRLFLYDLTNSKVISQSSEINDTGLITLTGTVPGNCGKMDVRIQVVGTGTVELRRVKLELGPVSTLQNDPPQDYGEELRKCQRYQWVTPYRSEWIRAAKVISDAIYFEVATPATFRANPTINTSLPEARLTITGFGTSTAASGFTYSAMSTGYGVRITANKENHGLKDATLEIMRVLFDANL